MVAELYLIRHGEAVSNLVPIIARIRGDRGLTERGRQQAALLEEPLRSEPLDADVLYVSTSRRAWETGDLHELRPGEADGLTIQEWCARTDREFAFGRGASATRVGRDPQNTSLTHWRHQPAPQRGSEWTLVTFTVPATSPVTAQAHPREGAPTRPRLHPARSARDAAHHHHGTVRVLEHRADD